VRGRRSEHSVSDASQRAYHSVRSRAGVQEVADQKVVGELVE